MNPFAPQEDLGDPKFIVFDDQPDQRVLLECKKCSKIVFSGKYFPELKILSWACDCGYISKQEMDLNV